VVLCRYVRIYVHKYIRSCVCLYMYICMYVCVKYVCVCVYVYIHICMYVRVCMYAQNYEWVFASMHIYGQSFWLQILRSRFWSPALPDFLCISGPGAGSTQTREPREFNWGAIWMKKVAAPGLEDRDYRLWGPDSLTTWQPSTRKSWY